MSLYRIRMDVADANLTGFASNMTGAGPWTMTTTVSGDTDGLGNALAHQVSIRNDSANNHAGKTVTLVGLDADGKAQTEVVTGPGASATVESAKYFSRLDTATPSATIGADTFDFGWVDDVCTKTYPLRWFRNVAAKMLYVEVGTVADFGVDFTIADHANPAMFADQSAVPWFQPIAALSAETGSNTAINDIPAGYTGFRCVITGYTNGGEAILYVSQPLE